MKTIKFLCFAIVLFSSGAEAAGFRIDAFMGTAHNLDSRITVYQSGETTLKKTADWCTCPFEQAPYYSLRVGFGKDGGGWEIEMLHHKITLRNTDTLISRFRATFGYNFFFVNHAWTVSGLQLRLGAGPIIAHPSSTVRAKAFEGMEGGILNGKYFLVGFGMQFAVGKRFEIWKGFSFNLEGKMTVGYANLPIAEGMATTPNYAFHGLGGFGYAF